ncbi:hypothetical protein ACSU1N_02920 [Thermogladius sp. 4427co]|uniref:hypothetical protein n=1 Tax=Thermogladius sp. 4427co TaxID=3450718 RepID=UPI003F7A91D6
MYFNISVLKGTITIRYLNSEYVAKTYICFKQCSTLKDEVTKLGLTPEQPIALIPESLVKYSLQILQGLIHYYANNNLFQRVKHRGLLLAMLILGDRQISELLENLEKGFASSKRYILVSADPGYGKPSNCEDYTLKDLTLPEDLTIVIKNIAVVLNLL